MKYGDLTNKPHECKMIPKLPLNIIFIIVAQYSVQNHIFCVHGCTENTEKVGPGRQGENKLLTIPFILTKKTRRNLVHHHGSFLEPLTPDSCWSNCWADLLVLYICWWYAARKPGLRKRGVGLTLEPAVPCDSKSGESVLDLQIFTWALEICS